MQHISGHKSLIGSTKSVTVLSNTGTMHFIIWGLWERKDLDRFICFLPPRVIRAANFLPVNICCLRIWAIPSPRAVLADHIMTCISLHTKNRHFTCYAPWIMLTALLFSVSSVGRLSSLLQRAAVDLQYALSGSWLWLLWCFSSAE